MQGLRESLTEAEQSLVIYKEALRIQEEIRDSEAKILEMEKEFLPKWPPLVQEKGHLALLQESLKIELQRIVDTSDAEEAFWAEHSETMGSMNGADLVAYQMRIAEARNNMLNRDFQTESELYESLLASAKRGDVESEYESEEFSIVDQPFATKVATGPRIRQAYIRYGVLGVGGGFLVAFILGVMDPTVRRIEDLENIQQSLRHWRRCPRRPPCTGTGPFHRRAAMPRPSGRCTPN